MDLHLTDCIACQQWQVAATRLTRSIRVRPAVPTPDLTERILAAATPADPPIRRGAGALRWGLGAVAFVQLSLALAQLLGVDHTGHIVTGTAEHFFNESAAWNFGLAIGFLVAAVRPSLARGLLPAVGVFVGVLAVVSATDVVSGHVDASRLGTHTMIVIGLALLVLIDRQERRRPSPGQRTAMAESRSATVELTNDSDQSGTDPADGTRSRRWLRPAGHRAA